MPVGTDIQRNVNSPIWMFGNLFMIIIQNICLICTCFWKLSNSNGYECAMSFIFSLKSGTGRETSIISAHSVDVTPSFTAEFVIFNIGISGSSTGGLMMVLSKKLSSSLSFSICIFLIGFETSFFSFSSSFQRPV